MNYYIELSDKRNQSLFELMKKRGFNAFELSGGEQGCAYVFSPAKKLTCKEVDNLCGDTTIYAGKLTEDVKVRLKEKNIEYKSYFESDGFATKNAALTAEGVLSLLISKTTRSIYNQKILVLGSGRCAREIVKLFGLLQLDYEVASRSGGDDFDRHFYIMEGLKARIGEFDVIINTIPAKLLEDNEVALIDKSAVYLEISSVNSIANVGLSFSYIVAPGLPSVFSEESAAEVMLDVIVKDIR